jgi:hypothetical protein
MRILASQNGRAMRAAHNFCEIQNYKIKLAINRLRGARKEHARLRAGRNARGRNQKPSRRLQARDNPQAAQFWRRERLPESQNRIF